MCMRIMFVFLKIKKVYNLEFNLTGIEVDGLKVEEAHFRGRKLHGATLPLPDGYSGMPFSLLHAT